MRGILTTLLAALLLPLAAAELTDAQWAQMKREALERPRPVIYDNDGDDVNYHHGEPTVEALLAKRTTWLCKYPVSTMVYCINGSTFQMKMPTRNGELFDCVWPVEEVGTDGKGHNVNAVTWLVEHGLDYLQMQIDYARAHGLEFFAEFRFNDTHDVCDTPEKPCPYFPRFKRQHPEFLMGSYEHQPPYATWSSYDFTHKEIRDKFVALVAEVADKYEVDGIFIDLYRWLGIFKSVAWGGTASGEETAALSEMFRQIRRATEAAGRRHGRPILLAIRCPDSLRYCRAIGFDWEGLMAEGVFDIVFPAGNNHFEPWGNSIALCHKYGVKCYPSIDMPSFMRHPNIVARLSWPSYWAREAAAYQAGADGLFYYNMFDEFIVANAMPPSPEAIRLKSKRYYISPICLWTTNNNLRIGNECNLLPELYYGRYATLMPGRELTFRLEFGDDLAALRKEGVPVRLTGTLTADGRGENIQISSNSVKWKYLGSHQDIHAFEVPPEALRPGVNDIVFTSLAKPGQREEHEIMSGDVLLQGDRQPPWRRIFPTPADNSDNESIVDGAYRIRDTGKGSPNLVYPLGEASAKNIDLAFEARVERSDEPLGAVVRLAGGGKVEIVGFQSGSQARPPRVGFHFANKYVPFDVESFHRYRVRMGDGRITLEADGTLLLEAPLVMDAEAPKAQLRGMSYTLPEMNTCSLVVGSLADAGQGISLWRHMRLTLPAGNVRLQDFALDVRMDAAAPRDVPSWTHEAEGVTILAAGKYAYHTPFVVGECDIVPAEGGKATICLSSGGMFMQFGLQGNALLLPGQLAILPAKPAGEPCRLRLEQHNLEARLFVDGVFCADLPARNVSMALRDDPAMMRFNEETGGVFRNSGLIVRPSGGTQVKALRVHILADED